MHVSTLEVADPGSYPLPEDNEAHRWNTPAVLLLAAAVCAAVAVWATHSLVGVPAALSAALM